MFLPFLAVAAILGTAVIERGRPRNDTSFWSADTRINLLTGATLAGSKWFVLVLIFTGLDEPQFTGLLSLDALQWTAQWVIGFLTLDFARWTLHVLYHRVPFLRAFHKVHHSSETLIATSGLRMHVSDFVQLAFVSLFLFGVLFEMGESSGWLIPAILAPGVIRDLIQHGNLDMNFQKRFIKIWILFLNNSHFHSWHHSSDPSRYDGNYGQALTVWDNIFGTAITPNSGTPGFELPETQRLKEQAIALQLLRRREH
jgi:sterol desaturase/sphingolipid hydroxylase (fatty acid hydroxylase superfamily)